MALRAHLRLPLFHPLDAKVPESDGPLLEQRSVPQGYRRWVESYLDKNLKDYLEGYDVKLCGGGAGSNVSGPDSNVGP